MKSEPVRVLGMPIRLEYTVTAGRHYSHYLRALAERRIIGARCSKCSKVYVPPRGSCPTCGVPTGEEVPVADTGTLTTFCVVNIPFANMPFDPPYVAAAILLDGADIPIFHLVRGVAPDDVRMGQRLRAVWVPDEKLGPTVESIQWFEASGEPDAPYDSYKEHM
jgi:uncharacterized protein